MASTNSIHDAAAHDDEPSDGVDNNEVIKQYKPEAPGGMRRVDSLVLARQRMPDCARNKSRKSNLGGDGAKKGDKSPRVSSVSVGILNIMGMGSSSSMVRA